MLTPPKTTAVRELQELAVGGEALADLRGELARRARGSSARGRLGVGGRGIRGEALQDRQREGGGLARAGLRDADQVAALQQVRDRLRLDGRGIGVVFFVERALERLGEGKLGEVMGRPAMASEAGAGCVDEVRNWCWMSYDSAVCKNWSDNEGDKSPAPRPQLNIVDEVLWP